MGILRRRAIKSISIAGACLAIGLISACGAEKLPRAEATAPPTASPTPAAEIILTGEAEISWLCGIPFDDPGCTAMSADGTDISKRIRRAGEVNWMTPGEYTLTYSLRIDGDELSLQRRIKVCPVGYPEADAPEKKVIYLTFDDGPCEYTPMLLETLKKYDARATFFVVTGNNKYLEDVLPMIYADGHAIGVHAESHDYNMLYASSESNLSDLVAARERIAVHSN